MQLLLVLGLLLAFFIAVFALQNANNVPINILAWHFNISLVLVILGSALAGGLAVFLAGLFHRHREKLVEMEKVPSEGPEQDLQPPAGENAPETEAEQEEPVPDKTEKS